MNKGSHTSKSQLLCAGRVTFILDSYFFNILYVYFILYFFKKKNWHQIYFNVNWLYMYFFLLFTITHKYKVKIEEAIWAALCASHSVQITGHSLLKCSASKYVQVTKWTLEQLWPIVKPLLHAIIATRKNLTTRRSYVVNKTDLHLLLYKRPVLHQQGIHSTKWAPSITYSKEAFATPKNFNFWRIFTCKS